ncbi:MAG: acyl-CoA dehydrogenase family protein, partial [Thermodesulfobacteriota bacterium]
MDFSISDEQRMFRETVYRFAKSQIAPLCEEADLKGEFNFDVWRKFGEMGLPGLPVPEKYGGAGADFVTCCLAGEAVGHAGVDGGHILAWGAPTYLCAAGFSASPHFMYSGHDDSGRWFLLFQIGFGGVPARPLGDGLDGHSLWLKFTNVPNEYLESYFPVRIETY